MTVKALLCKIKMFIFNLADPYRQPETTNHCLPLNGRCSHFCLPAPQLTKHSAKTACFCPDGMKLGKDYLNCEADREPELKL